MRNSGIAWWMAWLVAGVLQAVPAARAATLEGLLMPGPLASAHAELEKDCGSCHDRANRPRQRELCLGCHKDVASDLRARRGYHGRREEITVAQCSACHGEHRGRTARITPAVSSGFDHSRTDFALEAGHRQVACAACHQAGKRLREAPGGCVDCHRSQDPHQGKLGSGCATCHNAGSWAVVRFDHGTTRFALVGRHAQMPCAGCHAGNRWQQTPMACASCHTPDDVHRGVRGTDCAACHTQQTWADARFDHEKQAGFALLGAHQAANCQSCHRSGRFQDELPRDCAGCHRATDTHAGRLGTACADCHSVDNWKTVAFDHARDAKFALTGAHGRLGCHSCHVAPRSDGKLSTRCSACHRADDAHGRPTSTDCAACHGTTGWRTGLSFDHDVTDFPLLGQHAVVPCASCHISPRFTEAGYNCVACHRADDVHRDALGSDCARCHHPNAWNQWQFDHARESGFALRGAHARAQCGSCHRRPPGAEPVARECSACHATDDVHLGQFGRRCESCHSTISFRRVRPQ